MRNPLSSRILKSVDQAGELAGLRYPPFVYGGPLFRGQIPVFCLHDLLDERESFESRLIHFHRNGYVTLSLDEYVSILDGRTPAPERAVVITFDDGYHSTWMMATPLLRKYGMRATVFIIPERMSPGHTVRPTLDEVSAGQLSAREFDELIQNSPRLMTWEEARRAQASGVMDVESHSLTHTRVFTDPKVVDFVDPDFAQRSNLFTVPMLREGDRDVMTPQPELGTPLYRSQPRLASAGRYLESAEVRSACIEHVRQAGGTAFFEPSDWKTRLAALEEEARRETGPALYEDREMRDEFWRRELITSKERIEQELPGHEVRHFAYPWGMGHPDTIPVVREAGYASGFWLKAHGCWSRLVRAGHDLHRIPRLQALWMRSVPGQGRLSLRERLTFKAGRRFGIGPTGSDGSVE